MLKRMLLVIFLAGLFSAAWGQDFGLDVGCCSDPLTGAPVFVNGTGGGADGYFNSLNILITELSFVVDAGLGKTLSDFTCASFNFFKTCTPTYDSTTGLVTFDFSGVNPTDGDEGPTGTDNEAHGEFEGLPTLPTGCLAHPDDPSCLSIGPDKGHFEISFNTFGEGGSFNGNPNGTGTWVPGTSAVLETVNGHLVPEPSSVAWLAVGLLLVGALSRRPSAKHSGASR
jgi:hypothetical protein